MTGRVAVLATVLGAASFAAAVRADEPSWTGMHRLSWVARPYFVRPHFAGASVRLEYERSTAGGFLIAVAIDALDLGYPVETNGLQSRVDLGYASPGFSLAVSVGHGLPSYANARVGAALRIGRFDRLHALARVVWAVVGYTPAIPAAASLEVIVPVRPRWRLTLEGACGAEDQWYYLCLSGHVVVGFQRYLRGGGLGGTSLLRAGAGLAFMGQAIPGPLVTIGYERRY